MTARGFYQFEKNGEIKVAGNVRFESTGIKENGKVVWRKISKDGKRTNKFAEQFQPNLPWANGKWFQKLNTEEIVTKYPELLIEE